MVKDSVKKTETPNRYTAPIVDRRQRKARGVVILFLLGLIIPLFVYLGPLRLSVYRLVILVFFIPCLYIIFSGRVGKIRNADIFVVLLCLWSSASLVYHHGFALMVEPIGVLWLETFGSYLVGRCFIRTPNDFYFMVKFLFVFAIFLFPFGVYEALTGQNLIISAFKIIGPTIQNQTNIEPRMGLDRVQGPFDHPILFGVFFASMISLSYYVIGFGARAIKGVFSSIFVGACGALALSSGPIIAITTQLYMILWDILLHSIRSRWAILFGIFVLGYFVVDALSNRTPFHVLVTYLSFSPTSAYNRILIWTYGYQNIAANPVFGIGLNDWSRPRWMSSSIDMFWIVSAVRHGVPAWIFQLSAFFFVFFPVLLQVIRSRRVGDFRAGYLLTLVGLFVTGWTVHYWNSVFSYFMFLLGSGIWFLDYRDSDGEESVPPSATSSIPYSRFPRSDRRGPGG